jgi:hypothetical protein
MPFCSVVTLYPEACRFPGAAVIPHLQQVAASDLARSLGSLSVGLNPAEFTCPCSERARLEESGGPEPAETASTSFRGHCQDCRLSDRCV